MSYTIRLDYHNKVSQIEIDRALTIDQILEIWDPEKEQAVVGAILNHQVVHLNARIDQNAELKLLDIRTRNGQLIYERTLSFIFTTACFHLFPEHPVRIEHSLNNGLYAEFNNELAIDQGRVDLIKAEMARLIQADLPIRRLRISMGQMKEIYEKQHRAFRLDLNRDLDLQEVTISELDGYYDKFYGYLATRTGVVEKFDLTFHRPGMILLYPRAEFGYELPPNVRHEKIAAIFQESEHWAKILEISDVFSLNRQVDANRIDELIRISEALHEKKIAQIADDICNHPQKRVILIAGPSASGKTTFSKRLFIQLRVNERRPLTISLDNYFVDRDKTPKDAEGNFNFEALEAIDIDYFNQDLRRLLAGEAVTLPIFDFIEGTRKWAKSETVLEEGQPIVIEGIHGLNDALTPEIPSESKYKIYVSALTQLNIDSHNRIKTTDNRLMRRMVRDVQFRGASVERTLEMWPSVRRGEQAYIFPFQEEANAVFNSALVYEFLFLKTLLDPQLEKIGPDSVHYAEVKRLRKILYYFQTYTHQTAIPNTSILKEFLGGAVLNLEWIPDAIVALMKRFDQAGFELVLVGGAVRSYYAGEMPKDWDLSTSATPEEMIRLSQEWGFRTIPTGIRHGTLTWVVAGYYLEITTYRVEGSYEGYRRPLEMTFTKAVNKDLARRDFTMNAMAFHVHKGLLDPFGGRKDLRRGVLRAVGEPRIRLAEDALRSFRAIRFASRYGMRLDPKLRSALVTEGDKVRYLSGERVKQELDMILDSDAWQIGVAGLLEFRLLKDWIPVWSHLHHDTIMAGRWKVTDRMTRFALLMLMTDVELEESDWDLVRLRAGNAERTAMHKLLKQDPRVKRHFADPYDARKMIQVLGKKWVEPYLELYAVWHEETEEAELLRTVLAEDPVVAVRDLAIGGRDLIQLGFQPGPKIGEWLNECLELVLLDPGKNTRDALLAYIEERVG